MNLLEQYPDYAMMTNSKGERVTKPYVSGPSPLSQGLMAAGFGMMGSDESEWSGGGGFNWDAVGRGGLLGLNAYDNANKNLQDQRSEFYNQRNALEDQVIQNQAAKRDAEEYNRLSQERENRDKSFPEVLQLLRNSGRDEFVKASHMLQALYDTSPDKAVAASMNIVSQLPKAKPGEIKTHKIPGSNNYYGTQGGKYIFSGKGTESGGGEKLDKKTYAGKLTSAQRDDSTMEPDEYNTLYRGWQGLDMKERVFSNEKGLDTTKRYSGKIYGIKTPWDQYLNHPNPGLRLTAEEMTAKGWTDDPTISETVGTSRNPIPVTKQQSAYKIAQIVGAEDEMNILRDNGYDITKQSAENLATYYAGKWEVNPLSGPAFQNARTYESFAISGAMSFAYLFSGAAVRDEEMTQFRKTMYPMPGDSLLLVEAKRRKRDKIINLYNQMNPDSIKMAYALAKKEFGKNPPPLDMAHATAEIPNANQNTGQSTEELDKIADKTIKEVLNE